MDSHQADGNFKGMQQSNTCSFDLQQKLTKQTEHLQHAELLLHTVSVSFQ